MRTDIQIDPCDFDYREQVRRQSRFEAIKSRCDAERIDTDYVAVPEASWPSVFIVFVVAVFGWIAIAELVIHLPHVFRELYRIHDLIVRIWGSGLQF